jgi:hypothetical protein
MNTEEQKSLEIELKDLASCVTIIDIVTKRGAFEGAELADVGALRNRLSNFVSAHVEANKPEDEESE